MTECVVCDTELVIRWSDTHGVAVCTNCGMPYTIYFYDGNKKRIDKPPEAAIKQEWIDIGRRYWKETKGRVFPATYDMGILGNRERSYSGATKFDCNNWGEWLEQHESKLPVISGE